MNFYTKVEMKAARRELVGKLELRDEPHPYVMAWGRKYMYTPPHDIDDLLSRLCTMRKAWDFEEDEAVVSFFTAMEADGGYMDYDNHPRRYCAMPGMPGYDELEVAYLYPDANHISLSCGKIYEYESSKVRWAPDGKTLEYLTVSKGVDIYTGELYWLDREANTWRRDTESPLPY